MLSTHTRTNSVEC